MSDLGHFLNPRSIAILGAAPDPARIRGAILHMLQANGYEGALYPVNPSHREIGGLRCHASVGEIGQPIDLAVVVLPAERVEAALGDCAAAGVAHAVVISSGFAEQGDSFTQARIAGLARESGMRISGPNAEGFYNAVDGVAATFSPTVAPGADQKLRVAGGRAIGVVAQSGGMGFALYHRGRALGLAFSHVISTGNEADLSAADFFAHLADDPATGVIVLFLEAIRDPAGFRAAAARAAGHGKPVVVAKVGGSAAGARATASHTASLAGWHTAYRTLFRHFGMLEAADPDEAVAMAAALATTPQAGGPRVAGRRVGVVTLSGGAGAWAADRLAAGGLDLPELPASVQAGIARLLPSYGSARNPVDVTAQAVQSGGLSQSIETLLKGDAVDQVFAVVSLASEQRTSLTPAELHRLASFGKPLVCWSYAVPSRFARERFAEAGAVVFASLSDAVAAAWALAAPVAAPGIAPAPVPPPVLPAGRGTLSEAEARALLASNGIALPPARLVLREDDLAAAGAALGYPLAMKAVARGLPHKTEAGGVALGLGDAAALRTAWARIHASVARRAPGVALAGVLLAPMAAQGVEMIVGALWDPVAGAMVSLGAGGTMAELNRDVAWRLAPLDEGAARSMLAELRAAPLLAGYRGAPALDAAALARLVARVGALVAGAGGRVTELELNPVRVHAEGVSVLDALVTLAGPVAPGEKTT